MRNSIASCKLAKSYFVQNFPRFFISKGIVSQKLQWKLRFGKGCKVIASQKLGFLQYKFYDKKGNEIDLQEEIEKIS